ncbi:MAG: acyl-CoA dehydrogenase family protein [Candidatus Binataceae bacterium]|nr:acyl-CoA dehydrogenase family protein [Candidatus Binataceae bacterium]
MDFLLNDDERRLRNRVRALVNDHILPRVFELDETTEIAWDVAAMLVREQILGLAIPQEYGGVGPGVKAVEICLVREELARGSANVDVLFTMQGLGSYPIVAAGDDAQKHRFLPPIARAERLAGYAVTEAAAGSDLAMIETRADRRGDSYIINGGKVFISNAGAAGIYTVFAKTDPAAGVRGLSCFVVEKETPGLELVQQFDLSAPHCIGELRFKDCTIPASQLVGESGQGFRIAMQTFDVYRPSVGAAAIGMAQAGLEESIRYARKRVQFGRPLIDNQAIQFKLADMATTLDAARMLVYRAAKLKDSGAAQVSKETSMAKLFATEAAWRAIDEAVQIHGGNGVRRGVRVELLYRQVRALRIYEGTSEIQRLVIARHLQREYQD